MPKTDHRQKLHYVATHIPTVLDERLKTYAAMTGTTKRALMAQAMQEFCDKLTKRAARTRRA